jgi:hypothetical protein
MCRKKCVATNNMSWLSNSIRSWETEVWWELLYYHKTITTTLEPLWLKRPCFLSQFELHSPRIVTLPRRPRLGGHIFCFSRCVERQRLGRRQSGGRHQSGSLADTVGGQLGANPIPIVPMCKSLSHGDGIKCFGQWPVVFVCQNGRS